MGRFLQTDPVGTKDDQNSYSYAYNDALNQSDPTGQCAIVCTAIVGAGIEFLVQTIEKGAGVRKSYDVKAIGVAGVTSATGFGLAKQFANLERVGSIGRAAIEVTSDAAMSAASTMAKGEDVTVQGVVADVVAGQTAGKLAGQVAENRASRSPTNAQLDRAADRAARVAAQSERPGRQSAAEAARAAQSEYLATAAASASTIGANVGSAGLDALIKAGKCSNGDEHCTER